MLDHDCETLKKLANEHFKTIKNNLENLEKELYTVFSVDKYQESKIIQDKDF